MGLNTRKLTLLSTWTGVAAIVCSAGFYAATIHSMMNDDPVSLLACMEAEAPWHAWTCEQVLRHASLTAAQVQQLNQEAGLRFPLSMEDPKHVDEMVTLFLARGVDVNARDQQTNGWTALHGMSLGEPPAKAALLLKHGARVDIQDDDGRTPLDLARLAHQKQPANQHIADTILLLEEAQRKSSS